MKKKYLCIWALCAEIFITVIIFWTTFPPEVVKVLQKTPGVNFTNIFTSSFYKIGSQKRKNTVQPTVSFLNFWDLCMQKLLVKRWWNCNWILASPLFWSLEAHSSHYLHHYISAISAKTTKKWVWDFLHGLHKKKMLSLTELVNSWNLNYTQRPYYCNKLDLFH